MAKVPYTKLKLNTKRSEIITREWDGLNIEVKQYLPIEEVSAVVEKIVNSSVDVNGYYNPIRVSIYLLVETFLASTNVTVTEKQKDDIFKLYDDLMDSEIYQIVPIKNYQIVGDYVNELIHNIYEYKNSVYGILDGISTDYSQLDLDAQKIHDELADPENLTLLKDVLTKLG